MVHTTSFTSTSWTLSVLADSTMTHGDVASHRPSLLQSSDLFKEKVEKSNVHDLPFLYN
jgi:hypothetical protein